ncbi:hypothetical protein L7F22_054750 [Adiantum nelumboides]|nr:hypothetical protein [Adiantum nelumboides]
MATSEEKMHAETRADKPAPSLPAKAAAVATVAGIVVSLLALGGLAVAAVAIIATLAAPLLLFLSPILVPAGTLIVVTTLGILGAAGVALTCLVVFAWIYGYIKGRPVTGGREIESIQRSIAETVGVAKERAGEAVGTEKEKAGEAKERAQERAKAPSPPQEASGSSRGRGQA